MYAYVCMCCDCVGASCLALAVSQTSVTRQPNTGYQEAGSNSPHILMPNTDANGFANY